ncbi:STAS/SEC14 domain-containing protein [Oligoflexus tunisiensis]|uniref:STAS/SEC14 domain-containing protein n=1 Tax=Oligoflexus tunisiensis TaxID=708132 RepID=UPI00114CC5BF|nr:STAS/SEC14 domain-containing protein [Oligoflexus tunisiensis]
MNNQLWVEPVGNIIVARIRGVPTEAVLRDAQTQIIQLVKDTEQARVLYDALEMEAPPVEVPLSQWKLDQEIAPIRLRRAIVVPNTRIAYLARLAFNDDHRVFYNDLASAIAWLNA